MHGMMNTTVGTNLKQSQVLCFDKTQMLTLKKEVVMATLSETMSSLWTSCLNFGEQRSCSVMTEKADEGGEPGSPRMYHRETLTAFQNTSEMVKQELRVIRHL